MKVCYVDSSVIVSVIFEENGAEQLLQKLKSFPYLVSSLLLEAEIFCTLRREGVGFEQGHQALSAIHILCPGKSLSEYLKKILSISYLRGADAFHLATALWFCNSAVSELAFLTVDLKQREMAKELGFVVE